MIQSHSLKGFSLPELMLALVLAAITALTLVALSYTAISSRQKAENSSDAMLVADQQLERSISALQNLSPNRHNSIWNASGVDPYSEGVVSMGGTDYNFRIESRELSTGTAFPNRLRKLDILIWWWSDQATEGRGQGKLYYSTSRLVREVFNEEN